MTALVPNEDLLVSAVDGDARAMEALLREHTKAIEAVCFRRLRSRVDAEDAVQETLLRGMRALGHIEDPRRVQSYLCRIAERVCLDMMRDGARAMPQEIEDEVHEVDGPEESVLAAERDAMVRQALTALSARQAEALWMRDALERPVPEVAEHLGVTEGSARVLLTRARAKLRDGWQKVAALIPFTGKIPVVGGKAAAVLSAAAIAVPAAVIIVAVGGPDQAPVQTTTVTRPAVDVDTYATTTAVQSAPAPTAVFEGDEDREVREGDDTGSAPTAPAPSTATPQVEQPVITTGSGVGVTRQDPESFDDGDSDIDLYDEGNGGIGIELGEQEQQLINDLDDNGAGIGSSMQSVDPDALKGED